MTRTLRARLTALVALTGFVAIAALTVGFNLLLRSSLTSDAERVLEARGTAALQSLFIRNGQVKTREAPDEAAPDSGVWIYEGTRSIERPTAPASVDHLADGLARGSGTFAESHPDDLRLYAVPIRADGPRRGTIVVALSVEPYERSASRALVASVIFAGVMLALLVLSIRLVVNRALKPVAEMTSEAADWSEHDLDHRFNLGEPYDELTQLASTFDSMLAKLATNLRHEQRLTAEISHELRTPLAAISAEAELALRKPRENEDYRNAIQSIQRRAAQLAEVLEALLHAARGDAGSETTTNANAIAKRAIDQLAGNGYGVHFALHPAPSQPLVAVSATTGTQILTPLIENAGRYGRAIAEIRVTGGGESITFSISDDGPGIQAREVPHVFEPGRRGNAAAGESEGAGLGLALSRRLARAVGGDVVVVPSDQGGVVNVTLPSMHGP